MRRVVVTGMGCLSALGIGKAACWSRTLAGETGIQPIRQFATGSKTFAIDCLAAVAPDTTDVLAKRFDRRQVMFADRFANFAAIATLEALDEAGLAGNDAVLSRAAIIFGAASGGNVTVEAGFQRLFEARQRVNPRTVPQIMSSAATSLLSSLFGIRGICYSLSSACSSSSHAIAEGMHLIRHGRSDVVVVGGADASLTYAMLESWNALRAISPDGCRPFSADRNGTVLGEGAASLVLESEAHARERGATILAEIAGTGASSDAGHITQPDWRGAEAAIRAALADADANTTEPMLISAHGTGTVLNDQSETRALRQVFADSLSASHVIATKSAHGHMLGATASIELILGIMALNEGAAPPIGGSHTCDPECDLPLVLSPTDISHKILLSPSFAFGGLNSVLVARRYCG